MDFLIVLGDGFNVGVPAILSSHLLDSLLLGGQLTHACSESLVSSVSERSAAVSSWRLCHLVPLEVRLSKERNSVGELLRVNILTVDLVLVGNISVQYERGSVQRGLESALGRSHRRAILGSILN